MPAGDDGALDTRVWPSDLEATFAQIYRPNGFTCSTPRPESESADYGAYTFALNGRPVRFRIAKTTPTKAGQFVTLWKRLGRGPIQPFDATDAVDYFVVVARAAERWGQFVFPRSALRDRGILSINGVGGKRAIRIYPPWVETSSRQASATQRWQLEFFMELTPGLYVDAQQARTLYAG